MDRKDFLKATSAMSAVLLATPNLIFSNNGNTLKNIGPKIVRNNEGKTINVIGDLQTFKLTGKDTGGLFTLIEEENEPGVGIPPHTHTNEDEVFKVLEGEMELTVGDTTTVLKAGDLAFGPRGIPHSWKIIGTKKAKVILSVFPSGIEKMFEELGGLPPGPPNFPLVAEICGKYGIEFIK